MTDNLKWYAVQVYSGSEKKVAESIREQIQEKNLSDKIVQVYIPIERTVEIKRGGNVNSERNFFPGYILVKMILLDETWHLVKSTPKVTNFLGGNGTRPIPIPETEVQRIMSQAEEGAAKPKHRILFEIGQEVRVCEGAFNSFSGLVEEIDEEKERLKVSVLLFGRPTPVDLDYSQVKKSN